MKARALALAALVGMGRKTVTNLLVTSGMQFQDWSSAYRLFSKNRFDLDALFGHVCEQTHLQLAPGAPFVVAIDDTLLRKSGKKVHGATWRKDPLGPKFQTNLVWAQRFLQLSAVLPAGTGAAGARAVPVDFTHAPTPPKPGKNATQEQIKDHKDACAKARLPLLAAQRIAQLRKTLDRLPGGQARILRMEGDGSFTNRVIFRDLPERTVYTGRVRKDAKLHYLPEPEAVRSAGRKQVYGMQAPTPEQARKDGGIPWQIVKVWAAGKTREMRVKTLAPLRAPMAGKRHTLRMVVIEPLGYRLTKNSKTLYRQPAYLICTDPDLPLREVVQDYMRRWEIEVNHRDEKNILGTGQAQVRGKSAAAGVPAFMVAVYAMALLAAHQMTGPNRACPELPRPHWRKKGGDPARPPFQHIIQCLRAELWAKALGADDFSGFAQRRSSNTNPQKWDPNPADTLLYARQ